jgi:twitching motility protein PilJ
MSLVTALQTLLAKLRKPRLRARPTRLHTERSASADSVSRLAAWLGSRPVEVHQRRLSVVLALSLAVLGVTAAVSLRQADHVAQQVAGTGQALMQSQRLAKAVSQALVGHTQAFLDVKESADVLARNVRGLVSGDEGLGLVPADAQGQAELVRSLPLVTRTADNAAAILRQEKILTQVGQALRAINRQSSDLLELAESVSSLKLQQGAAPSEVSAAGQLVMLTQRISKSANEFLTLEGLNPEAVFMLGKDLRTFRQIGQGLLEGSPELRLAGTRDTETRERLQALLALYDQTRTEASAILGNLQGLVAAREAQAAIIADSEPLRRSLQTLQDHLSSRSGLDR